MEIAIAFAAKFAEYTVTPIVRLIERHIVCPIARLCPFKDLWEHKSNLEKLKTKVKQLEAERVSVQDLTNAGVEPLPDVIVWLDKATKIINEVSRLIGEDDPETGYCGGCTECYQHRNNVARKLKGVAQLLREAREPTNLWEYKSNLENLKKEVDVLKAKRERVNYSIKVGEEPLPDVKLWQEEVNRIINEVSGLINEKNPEHQNNVARKLTYIAKLLQEEVQFREVSYQPIREQTCLQPSIQQESFESRMPILKDIIAALSNADVNKVGIHGMGGVGKTTLAKKVGNQALQDKLFDKIVFVEVSQSPDIRTIQGVIAHYLGFKFEEEDVRAEKLCNVLKKEKKKILIILDNLWEGIELEEVGIPIGDDCKGLKLLLTARSRNVLTNGMNSPYNFHVEVLSEKDAWILFKSIAGTCVDHPHLKTTAIEVAKKCGGMPLAIVTVAKALKDKEVKEEWKDASQKLDNPSTASSEGITKGVYNSIKWSYDCLDGKHKEIFLLCSRMGRTYDASIQDLFRYGLGLGFFDEFDTVEDALCNVYTSVNQLKAASLLFDPPENEAFLHLRSTAAACERFAIHDVICNVARSIASKERRVFPVLYDHIPRSLTNENTLKNCTSITLYNISGLPENLELVCPNLEFLYVQLKHYPFLTIPNNFFVGMSRLQVLHLIHINLVPLPTSLSCLLNLQALCLDYCELGDIVVIGNMKKLKILSFRYSDIKKLPREMCQLTKLRLLDLTHCSELSFIPSKVISSLTEIEALYMGNTCIQWEVAGPNIEGSNVSIDELKHLRRLTILEMDIPHAKMFRGLISLEPKRYKIFVGRSTNWRGWEPDSKISRMLRLELDIKEDWIISQLPGVEKLELKGEVVGAINLLDDLDRNGFPQLMHLCVSRNNHCACIVNSVSCAVLPSLESLMVRYMESLEKICNSPLGADSFLYLKTIHVKGCNKLCNIFCFFSIVRVLPRLIDLQVSYCENVEEIFALEEQDDGNITEVVHDIKFSQLSCLKLIKLPKLKSFCCKAKTASPLQLASDTSASEELNNPLPLFNEKVMVTNLEMLEIRRINVKTIWDNQLQTISSIQNLTCLIISNLANLRRLGLGDYIKFPSLKEMTIRSCPKFDEFIFDDKVAVPNLEKIKISNMDNLKMIWHNQLSEDSFLKLKLLRVEECQKLLALNMCGTFLGLETLYVSGCGSLEEILELQGTNSEERDTTSTQSREYCTYKIFSFASLQNFKVSECQSLKNLFYAEEVVKEAPATARFVFPKLGTLELHQLPELRTFYPGRYTTEWPVLKMLKMYQCGIHDTNEKRLMERRPHLPFSSQVVFEFQVGTIWPNLILTMYSWVQNLTMLTVHDCGNLEELFPCSMIVIEELREKKKGNTIVFPKLYYLEMEQLGKLKGLCSGYHIEFPTLEIFKISNCPELTAFIFDNKVTVPSLKEVKISSMDNLMMIWDNQLAKNCIPKLKSLQVQGCHKMLTLLQSNMCESFSSLETLDVSDCGSLEEIFDLHAMNSEERHFATSTQSKELYTIVLSFSSLQKLKVSECGSLKSLFSVSNVAKERVAAKETDATAEFLFQKLTSLELYKLPQLRTFNPGRYTVEWPILRRLQLWDYGIPDTNNEEQMQHLFLVEKAVRCLEELILSGRELMMMWQGQDPERLFRNFKTLEVLDESDNQLYYFRKPILRYIGDVKYMWKQNFKLDLILPNFEDITVVGCDNFISLMPPSASFQNLTSLAVYGCDSLEHIGTFSTAKNLVKLESLTISWCEKIVEVLRNHGDVTGDKILFKNLKHLSLQHLSNLTSFCSWHCTLEFPSLEELEVHRCPNMEIFCRGELTTPKLHEVESGRQSIKLCPDVDLNEAIKQLDKQKGVTESSTEDENDYSIDESEEYWSDYFNY